MKNNILNEMTPAQLKRKKNRESAWYDIKSLLGYINDLTNKIQSELESSEQIDRISDLLDD